MIEIRDLYNRFKTDILSGENMISCDEDILLDVFDYARGIQDTFVQMEVLFMAAKLFPDNPEFLCRRGLLYKNAGDEAYDDFLTAYRNDNAISDNFIWKLFLLEKEFNDEIIDRAPTREQRQKYISKLMYFISEADYLCDEDIFQMRDMLARINLGEDFINSEIPDVKGKVDHPATWMYELGCIAEEADMFKAVEYFTACTDQDAFTIEAWLAMAECYTRYNMISEAKKALEFAASLRNGDDTEMLEAEAIANFGIPDSDECLQRGLDICSRIRPNEMSMSMLGIYLNKLVERKDGDVMSDFLMRRLILDPSLDNFCLVVKMFPQKADKAYRFVKKVLAPGIEDGMMQEDSALSDPVCETLHREGIIPLLVGAGKTDLAADIVTQVGTSILNTDWMIDFYTALLEDKRYFDLRFAIETRRSLSSSGKYVFPDFYYGVLASVFSGEIQVAKHIISNIEEPVGLTTVQLQLYGVYMQRINHIMAEMASGKDNFSPEELGTV